MVEMNVPMIQPTIEQMVDAVERAAQERPAGRYQHDMLRAAARTLRSSMEAMQIVREIHQLLKRGSLTEDHGLLDNLRCIRDHIANTSAAQTGDSKDGQSPSGKLAHAADQSDNVQRMRSAVHCGYTGGACYRRECCACDEPLYCTISRMRLDAPALPVPMILHCPRCRTQHVDAPQPEKGWTNPPHRSHECQACGYIWRPADIPTVGVAGIMTRGLRDSTAADQPPSEDALLKAIDMALSYGDRNAVHAALQRAVHAALQRARERIAASSWSYEQAVAADQKIAEARAQGVEVEAALRAYVLAQSRMLDKWADGDENVKRDLWRALHACEDAGRAALARPEPSGKEHK